MSTLRPIRTSTVLALVSLVGFVGFAVIDFKEYPWVEFTAWAILVAIALVLSAVNLVRYRSARYLGEIAAELFVLVSFQNRLLLLFRHAG